MGTTGDIVALAAACGTSPPLRFGFAELVKCPATECNQRRSHEVLPQCRQRVDDGLLVGRKLPSGRWLRFRGGTGAKPQADMARTQRGHPRWQALRWQSITIFFSNRLQSGSFMFNQPRALLLMALFSGPALFGADFVMKVTDRNYLDTQGFSVFLYDSTYHPVFVDQKNTAMEMILHGQRIATNGDVRLMPTPEQWDLVAQLKGRQHDKDRLTANLSFPSFQMDYTLEVAAEPGGVRVSVNLDKPLPEKLAGRAGFNLEFLPSIYMGKTYAVDNASFGVFPRVPRDPLIQAMPLADEPKKLYYLEDWDNAQGYTQPLRFAEGRSITMAVDDAQARITIQSDTGNVAMFDGRNRAQNGWFVLRTLIPAGKTVGAVVWHIRPNVIPNWTRPPLIAASQVGYAPNFSKVAVLELDPKFNAPRTAKVLRLGEDGAYKRSEEHTSELQSP